MLTIASLATFAALAAPAPHSSAGPVAALSPTADTTIVVVVAPEGNRARFRVREQLARLDFPNDAVGETRSIQGRVVVHSDGTIDREASAIVIDMTALESDSDRRDNFLRRNTLNTDEHPTLTLIPTAFRGLPAPVPTEGEHTFLLVADMILKGERHPTTWEVRAIFANGAILGQASTILTFDGIRLEKPRVGSVLSVADDIRLEYEFRLVPEGAH